MKTAEIHIGCSAYDNAYWAGFFYPENLPRNKRFDFYAENFKTFEINSTFYKFPTVRTLRNWAGKVPEDFVFSVKAFKGITHLKRFQNCQGEIQEFYEICREGLGTKLGYVLFQLPPSFHYSEEKLRLVLENLDPKFKTVVEFRHESWWNQTVFDAFETHNLVFCSVSYPKLPETIIAINGKIYLRLHGREKLFYSHYSNAALVQFTKEILAAQKLREVFIYANNTASAAGILNAETLKLLFS